MWEKSAGSFEYVVTCRHVIEGIKGRPAYIRINNKKGMAIDYPTAERDWVCAAATDVAVCPLRLGKGARYWPYPLPFPPPDFMPTQLENSIRPGHPVFFVGLFHPVPGEESVQAIVRSGTMARSSVVTEIWINGAEKRKIQCHVVEALSWGGESGSPVFIYENAEDAWEISFIDPKTGERGPVHSTQMRPTLLGMFHGHFQLPHDVQEQGRIIGRVDVNTGIGVVIPIRHIQETLKDKRLVADRRQTALQRKKERESCQRQILDAHLSRPTQRRFRSGTEKSGAKAQRRQGLKEVTNSVASLSHRGRDF
jgi:hypothetical protein